MWSPILLTDHGTFFSFRVVLFHALIVQHLHKAETSAPFSSGMAVDSAPTPVGNVTGKRPRSGGSSVLGGGGAGDVDKVNEKLEALAAGFNNIDGRLRCVESGVLITVTGPKDCPMLSNPKEATVSYVTKVKGNKKHNMGSPHQDAVSELLKASYLSGHITAEEKKTLDDFSKECPNTKAHGVAIPVCRVVMPFNKDELKMKLMFS